MGSAKRHKTVEQDGKFKRVVTRPLCRGQRAEHSTSRGRPSSSLLGQYAGTKSSGADQRVQKGHRGCLKRRGEGQARRINIFYLPPRCGEKKAQDRTAKSKKIIPFRFDRHLGIWASYPAQVCCYNLLDENPSRRRAGRESSSGRGLLHLEIRQAGCQQTQNRRNGGLKGPSGEV